MRDRMAQAMAAALLGLVCSVPSIGADAIPLDKDLTAVIALLGLPCGRVVQAERSGPNDHLATCSDGNRYRVFLDAQGRVVAQKR